MVGLGGGGLRGLLPDPPTGEIFPDFSSFFGTKFLFVIVRGGFRVGNFPPMMMTCLICVAVYLCNVADIKKKILYSTTTQLLLPTRLRTIRRKKKKSKVSPANPGPEQQLRERERERARKQTRHKLVLHTFGKDYRPAWTTTATCTPSTAPPRASPEHPRATATPPPQHLRNGNSSSNSNSSSTILLLLSVPRHSRSHFGLLLLLLLLLLLRVRPSLRPR